MAAILLTEELENVPDERPSCKLLQPERRCKELGAPADHDNGGRNSILSPLLYIISQFGIFREFLSAVAGARTEVFKAVGEGEDVRLSGKGIAGGALGARDRVVHLCAFNTHPEASRNSRTGFARASQRRMRY